MEDHVGAVVKAFRGVMGVAAIDLAQETQGDVEILLGHPARAGEAAADQAQLPADVVRQAEGYKEAHDPARN